MCETRLLSRQDKTFISDCAQCKMVHLWHQNLLVSFYKPEFDAFCKNIFRVDFECSAHPFPDGENRVIVNGPHENIHMAFNLEEWLFLKDAITEARQMMGIHELMI